MGLTIPMLYNNANHPVRFGAFGRRPQPRLQDQEIASRGQPQSNLKAELVNLFTVPRRPPAGNPACQQTSGL
jgi:hypothetical protein